MKKGFFKKAACAALSVMMIAGTTACGGGSDGKTLKYAVWGSSDEMAIINQIVEGFETLYAEEGYKVDLVQYSSDYYNKIQLITFYELKYFEYFLRRHIHSTCIWEINQPKITLNISLQK